MVRLWCVLLCVAMAGLCGCQGRDDILMIPKDGASVQWVQVQSDAEMLARHIDRQARWIVAQAVLRASCVTKATQRAPRVVHRAIPSVRIAVPKASPAPTVHKDTTKIDLNRASLQELEQLPHVGPVTARSIVAGRPYLSIKDLLRVRGIGPKTLEKIRPLLAL